MKKKNSIFLILPVVALVLEALPWGVVLNFANPEGAPWRHTYSYFSLTPFGYATFPPLLVALLTCVLLILVSVYIVKQNKGLYNAIAVISATALGLSLVNFLYGVDTVTVIGVLVPIILWLHICLFVWKGKPQ